MTNEDRNVFLEHLGCWTLAVEFDLPTEWYVPAEHDSYWDACRAAMSAVNENRAARGMGAVKATELARVEWKRRAEWLAHERGETPPPPEAGNSSSGASQEGGGGQEPGQWDRKTPPAELCARNAGGPVTRKLF